MHKKPELEIRLKALEWRDSRMGPGSLVAPHPFGENYDAAAFSATDVHTFMIAEPKQETAALLHVGLDGSVRYPSGDLVEFVEPSFSPPAVEPIWGSELARYEGPAHE